MASNAFLTNTNTPLGTEVNDGLRIGPFLDRYVLSGTSQNLISTPYPYNQWGLGLLQAPINSYNIIARGPNAQGNIVGYSIATGARPSASGYLVLSGDSFVTTAGLLLSGNSYLQLDWPRSLSVTVVNNNLAATATITVFGTDYYGVQLQEAITFKNIGTYTLKKAFYTVTNVYYNGPNASATGSNSYIFVQATDNLGLPYQVNSEGDILGISWGNTSDMGTSFPIPTTAQTEGTATLVAGTVTVATTAVSFGSTILISRNTPGGTIGFLNAESANIVDFTSFEITATSDLGALLNTDTSTVNWKIINSNFASGISSSLINNTVAISTTQVQQETIANKTYKSFIHFGRETPDVSTAGVFGNLYVSQIQSGSGFSINSTEDESSTIDWAIMPSSWVSGISKNIALKEVTIYTPQVQTNSIILVNYNEIEGTTGTLSVPSASIVAGTSFVVNSDKVLDTSTVVWTIAENIPGLTQGTATLVAGTVTVATTAVTDTSIILLNFNTPEGTQGFTLYVSGIENGVNFDIQSLQEDGTEQALDTSTVNWVIFPYNYQLPFNNEPLGIFTPADNSPASNTTGDVRGTYLPSTPLNGVNILHFINLAAGYDNFVTQQSTAELPAGGTTDAPLTRTALSVSDQYGVAQYYTGVHA